MKTATFYELTSKDIVVSGDYFQLARFQSMPFRMDENLWGATMNHVEAVNVPVHHIKRCQKIEGVYGRDGQEAIKTQDYFIAMSPELASLLSAPFEEKVQRERLEKQKLIDELHCKNAATKCWWEQPWWKRVIFAIRG